MVTTSSGKFLSPAAYKLNNQVCVLPCGGLTSDVPLTWSADQLKYYTSYIVNGQPIDSLFKGFIFNGVRMRDSHFIHPLYIGFEESSDMTDWQLWLDTLFAPEANLQALHSLAGDVQRDVWISIPYPHPFQRAFGWAQERSLDFQSDQDRLSACIWWIERFIIRWQENVHLSDKLYFRGFLWQKEVIDDEDELLVKWVNAYIHSKKYLSMWLPNYGSARVTEWDMLGFHVTALHTNYSGNISFDTSWIHNTSLFCKYFNTGLQLVWGKGIIYSDTHHLDYFNYGLETASGYMNDTFLVYQFPNQTLEELYQHRITDYILLYLFTKGLYHKIEYNGITY